jgi:hypothetical protein
MLKQLSKDPGSYDWTAEQWGQFLCVFLNGEGVQDLD